MGFSFISMRITTTASISKEARQARLGRQAFGLCGFPCHVPIPAVSAACSVCSLRDGETHEPPRNAAAINNNNNIHHHHFATLPLDSLIIRSSTNYRQSSHFATSSSSFCHLALDSLITRSSIKASFPARVQPGWVCLPIPSRPTRTTIIPNQRVVHARWLPTGAW